jgi:hypothetical protein
MLKHTRESLSVLLAAVEGSLSLSHRKEVNHRVSRGGETLQLAAFIGIFFLLLLMLLLLLFMGLQWRKRFGIFIQISIKMRLHFPCQFPSSTSTDKKFHAITERP